MHGGNVRTGLKMVAAILSTLGATSLAQLRPSIGPVSPDSEIGRYLKQQHEEWRVQIDQWTDRAVLLCIENVPPGIAKRLCTTGTAFEGNRVFTNLSPLITFFAFPGGPSGIDATKASASVNGERAALKYLWSDQNLLLIETAAKRRETIPIAEAKSGEGVIMIGYVREQPSFRFVKIVSFGKVAHVGLRSETIVLTGTRPGFFAEFQGSPVFSKRGFIGILRAASGDPNANHMNVVSAASRLTNFVKFLETPRKPDPNQSTPSIIRASLE